MIRVLLFGTALLMARGLALAAQPTFHWIGDLPGGTVYSRADSVSNGGTVVVGASGVENRGTEGFRWTPEAGIHQLPGASDIRINDVTPDGAAVFGWTRVSGPVTGMAQ